MELKSKGELEREKMGCSGFDCFGAGFSCSGVYDVYEKGGGCEKEAKNAARDLSAVWKNGCVSFTPNGTIAAEGLEHACFEVYYIGDFVFNVCGIGGSFISWKALE
ncbi:hypothetical protein HB825_04925 [Listeria booriae]|uniref:hypothetical protein n=1 Tax=Listeria booriae TaxID=1552123 RepID=UPI00164D65D2|nr:hypothetical protein [Listeria booriae]MBC6134179.1 hypothetical protein [Listeria booriae]